MRLIAMLLLFSALTVTTAFADAPTTAQGEARVFFEPTQEDFDCCHVEIGEQQTRYEKAKGNGDYDEAVANALYFWTRAWLHFNEGIKVWGMGGVKKTAEELNEALALLDKAEADAIKAEPSSQTKDCLAKVKRNRKTIATQLKAVEQGAATK
jgi:hypothetical protein